MQSSVESPGVLIHEFRMAPIKVSAWLSYYASIAGFIGLAMSSELPYWAMALVWLFAAVMVALGIVRQRVAVIRVDSEGLRVRGLGGRRIPWSEIESVSYRRDYQRGAFLVVDRTQAARAARPAGRRSRRLGMALRATDLVAPLVQLEHDPRQVVAAIRLAQDVGHT